MTAVSNSPVLVMIRLGQRLSLIFFVLVYMFACKPKEAEVINIVWTNKQASAVTVPRILFKFSEDDSIAKHLQIRLENSLVAMLGDYSIFDDYVSFKPLIPFSRGLRYEIIFQNKPISKFFVPLDSGAVAASLLTVYPTTGVVPENLLKFYLQFSAPMRAGEALRHIALLNENNDTLPGIFLDLQPELWNKEGTVLTLWLDPGRIKRDLIPNRRMGNPLKRGEQYTLIVSDHWKNVEGLPLEQSFNRKFLVGPRDSSSPQLRQWVMNLPETGTAQPLKVNLGEPLDYFLLQETIHVLDETGKVVDGSFSVNDNETSFSFLPTIRWRPGRYRIQVASYLEDLAGNNLERLFDRDIRLPQVTLNSAMVEKEFMLGVQK